MPGLGDEDAGGDRGGDGGEEGEVDEHGRHQQRLRRRRAARARGVVCGQRGGAKKKGEEARQPAQVGGASERSSE